MNVPSGCRFHPRRPETMPDCRSVEPALTAVGKGRRVACHLHASQGVVTTAYRSVNRTASACASTG
ncbi:MAG: hypothetical protein U1F52_04025 [Burkholderiales bacterium]